MLLYWNGHSEFLLESADGYRVLTDPYDAHVGYPMKTVRADAVTVSHAHGDHSYTEKVSGSPMILTQPGVTRLTPTVSVSAIEADHDDDQGRKRGKTLLTVITMDDLRIAHLGDLGCLPDASQREFLRNTDILLIPVGGYYTIDAAQAAETVRLLQPRVTIPMHYRTRYNSSWPIAPVEDFLQAMHLPSQEQVPLLRITPQDIECCRSCYVFETP